MLQAEFDALMIVKTLLELKGVSYITTNVLLYFSDVYVEKKDTRFRGSVNSYVVSSYDAVLVGLMSLLLIAFNARYGDEDGWYETSVVLTRYLVTSLIGYFVYDLYSSSGVGILKFIDVVHHTIAISVCSSWMWWIADPTVSLHYIPYITLVETSTVFYNIRWLMYTLDLHTTYPTVHHYASLMFAFVYALTRIIIFPTVCLVIFNDERVVLSFGENKYVSHVIFSTLACLVAMQIYWFLKIVKMVYTTIASNPSNPTTQAESKSKSKVE